MATTKSVSKPQAGYGGGGLSVVYTLGSVDVGSAEADLIEKQSGMACKRLGITIKNGSDTDITAKFFSTDEADPSGTHAQAEWDQEPDSSTSYTVGSASLTTDRKKVILTGPIRWWKVRGNHTTVTSTGSVTIIANYQW